MASESISSIIKTSLVTAFTIAAALIWKDFIDAVLFTLVPQGRELAYHFLAAVLATILVIIAIYFVLKTELEVEKIIRKEQQFMRKGRQRKQAS